MKEIKITAADNENRARILRFVTDTEVDEKLSIL